MPSPRHPFLAIAPALLLAFVARAQTPALLTPIANPPASALAWLAGERTANATIVGSTFVQVNTAALLALPTLGPAPLGTLTLALGGTQFLLDVDRADWSLGYRTFRGTARGEESEVHLSLAADGTTAGLIDVDGGTWLLTAGGAPGVHALLQIDTKREPASNSCGVDHTHLVRGPVTATAGPLASQLTNSDCAQTTLDIAVFYTPEARLDAGGQSAIETVIVGAVSQANAGHLDSGAPIEFRLVHMAETNYVETGSGADLSAFRDPSDGQMDEVHQARNDYGADLMHLIISPNSSSFCGIGYLLGSLSSSFESSAFAVTRRTCISNRTFTHECGHNMGCHHDAANAGAAIFPYAYGYRTPDNALRTIMAYSPGTRINRWSSPNVVFQGYTMGVAGSADNVQTITDTCLLVSQFRATVAPRWCDLAGGIAGAAGVPTMTGSGTINQLKPLRLTIEGYAPGSIGILLVGGSAINVPLFGGTLVPSPDILLTLIGSSSSIPFDCSWLANLAPGTQAWLQSAFLDPAAVEGLSASDAVLVTVP